jgi:hypothetical protein
MRLSGFVVAAILLASVNLLAQHSSGGGSSSGGSHASSASGSGSFHSSGSAPSSSARTGQATTGSTARTHAPASIVKPEKKGFFSSLLHKKEPPKSSFCGVGGSRSASGACLFPAQAHSCQKGQVWTGFGNGYGCSQPYQFFNDCSALANELAAEQLRMRGQSDPGAALFYRLRLQQYESCLARGRGAYDSWAYNSVFLFDAP